MNFTNYVKFVNLKFYHVLNMYEKIFKYTYEICRMKFTINLDNNNYFVVLISCCIECVYMYWLLLVLHAVLCLLHGGRVVSGLSQNSP